MTHFVLLDYIWLDGKGGLRSKTRVIYQDEPSEIPLNDVPTWNYDGSSTFQANTKNSEIVLVPVRLFRCPFRSGNAVLVLCKTYNSDGTPAIYNHRHNAEEIFQDCEAKPWYGIEQEYFMFDYGTDLPLGFDTTAKQGKHYCGVGSADVFGRNISEQHMQYCLYAGIKISGTNAEVAPGQWEYQVGPVEGIDAADQLWVSRYILLKITEQYGVYVSFHPKPVEGDWNGSGCHINFSTLEMREEGGLEHINNAVNKLSKVHGKHMEVYGRYNHERMSGNHETSGFNVFSYGVGSRDTSIRIPLTCYNEGNGYLEDRRPGANMDPYLATSIIYKTISDE
jgi:glutamine synthetase